MSHCRMLLASTFLSLPLAPSLQGQAHARPEVGPERSDQTEPSVLRVFEGIVVDPEGAPAEGAVVVSSAGGKAVTDRSGSYRLEVRVPAGVERIELTAVGGTGGSLAASTSVSLAQGASLTRVAPLELATASTCQPSWLPTFGGQPGTSGIIRALAVHDDGSGPELYAGGIFTAAGGTAANHIAKWNGSSWTALGSGLTYVFALTVYDEGSGPALYAGGGFSTAVNHIAKWNGSSWSALGNGMDRDVVALTVHDDGSGPALYAAGEFTTAGGTAANSIAKWNGSSWMALGSGMSSTVLASTVFNDRTGPALYAGGDFGSALDSGDSYLAKWGCLDTNPPTITCPASLVIDDRGSNGRGEIVAFTVAVEDGEDPTPSLVCVPPSGSLFSSGTTTVTCTATDFSGNQSTCQFDVTVHAKVREP